MDMRIQPGGSRTDVATTDTAPRVTPSPGVPFADVVGRSAGAIARGAEAAVTSLPGAPIVAAAVRGGPSPSIPLAGPGRPIGASGFLPSGSVLASGAGPVAGSAAGASVGSAESPVGAPAASTGAAGVEQTLAQSQEFNLYYLQLQESLAAENRSYTAMSNVLKARHDTVKNAIGNIR